MYQFVDTTAGSTSSASLSLNTIFNGHNLDQLLTDDQGSFATLTVTGRSHSEQLIETIDIMGMDGLLEQDNPDLTHRQIEVKYKITDKSSAGLRQRLSRLNHLLEGSKKQLQFTDEDFLFYATMQSHILPEEESNTLIASIVFLCSDPYKYGEEKESVFASNTLKVNNEGTATAYPIFEFEVLAPITFAMVQNHLNEYLLLGYPVDEDVKVVEQNVLVYDSNGEDINEWSTSPVNIDDINNQIVSGEIGFDGTGFIATDYGTGDYGHGPAIIREIPSALSDFEVEVIFDTRDEDVIENFRTELYLFSEGMDMIGKLGINDNTASLSRRRAHGRVGEHTNLFDPKYAISPNNYQYDDMGLATFSMRMIRMQGCFTFYIARIDSRGRHVQSMTRSYATTENDSNVLGNLKFIQLYIRTYDNRPVSLARINRVRVYQKNIVQEDQTPYIATTGDVITFDAQNEEMLLNGEDATPLKDFGGHYFTLKTGENELTLHPEENFNATVRYQERFK
ncbi:distal tail protein Dit [Amphibacillus jilinensis]|uniref:distal tail protein Dit n=1 Tax=Amphibacillus jilinensis TaxID=1216008 RepID=UPI0003089164|nr:distal tail protein Dit [Amphibacillus jilinensis]